MRTHSSSPTVNWMFGSDFISWLLGNADWYLSWFSDNLQTRENNCWPGRSHIWSPGSWRGRPTRRWRSLYTSSAVPGCSPPPWRKDLPAGGEGEDTNLRTSREKLHSLQREWITFISLPEKKQACEQKTHKSNIWYHSYNMMSVLRMYISSCRFKIVKNSSNDKLLYFCSLTFIINTLISTPGYIFFVFYTEQ